MKPTPLHLLSKALLGTLLFTAATAPAEELAGIVTVSRPAAEVETYMAVKGQRHAQTNAGTPVQISAQSPFAFLSTLEAGYDGAVTNVSLKLPSGVTKTVTNLGDGEFEFTQNFTSKTSLENAYKSGNYKFTITAQSGLKTPTLVMPASVYPQTPRILNWAEAQVWNNHLPFTLQWQKFTNGTTKDFVMLEIYDTNDTAFSSPGLLESSALSGTNTSYTFSPGTLEDGRTYTGRLLLLKKVTNTNALTGALGISGYFRETSFPIVTLPEPPEGGRFQFKQASFTASESNAHAVVTIIRDHAEEDGSVLLTTANGTAQAGQDYSEVSTTVFLPAGVTETNVNIPVLEDIFLEAQEKFTVSLSRPLPTNDVAIGAISTATVLLNDNESSTGGAFEFSSTTYKTSETNRTMSLTINRTKGTKGTAVVTFATVGLTATAADGFDFVGTNGTVTFTAGQTTKKIPVRILNDALVETNEFFFAHIAAVTGTGVSLGAKHTATVTISDDDKGGTLNFSTATFSVNENATNAVLTVKRSSGKAGGVTVDYFTTGGTASDVADFSPIYGQLTFGSNELTKTFTIGITNDLTAEALETFTVRLTNAVGGATIGRTNLATVKIVDDESSFSFSTNAASVTESKTLTVTIIRNGARVTPASVVVSTAGGTATSDVDFEALNTTVSFAAGTASKTVTIKAKGDPNFDTNETFTVSLSNPGGGAQLASPSNLVVTIINGADPDGIPVSGSAFLKATITGVDGNTVSKSLNVSGATVVGGSYSKQLGLMQGLTGLQTTITLIPFSSTMHTLQFTILKAPAPGVIPINPSSTHGGAVWSFIKTPGPDSGNHTYGTGSTGSSGSVTIDAINESAHTITGRFDFIAVDDKANSSKKVRIKGSFRVKNVQFF